MSTRMVNRQNLLIGRILGIPIRLDLSWFLIFGLLTWTLAVSYFPKEFKGWPVFQYWALAAVTVLVLFGSLLLHELAHSLVARFYKIPVRSVTLFIFGGMSEIGAEPPNPAAEFWIAIAGPLASLTLAACFLLLRNFSAGVLLAPAKYLALINGTIALFNLIPGFPLDGGRVLRALLWKITRNLHRASLSAAAMGRVVAFLFITFGVWQILAGNLPGGVWTVLIGWFLDNAALSQVQQWRVREMLASHTVSEAMSSSCPTISPEATLQHLVDDFILGRGKRAFLVESGEKIVGSLTVRQVKKVPRAEWPATRVSQAMQPVDPLKAVQPATGLWVALEAMDGAGINQLPVVEGGRVMGLLTREDVSNYLRTLRELGV